MLHPNQFYVNEAWIAFQLNATPVQTEADGDFNCVSLMDAASCFMMSSELISVTQAEPSALEARRLLKNAWARKREYSGRIILPDGQFATHLAATARKLGIDVVSMPEADLIPIIGEARDGFEEHFSQGMRH